MKEAVLLGQERGFVRSFVDEGKTIAVLMRELRSTDDANDEGADIVVNQRYLQQLLLSTGMTEPAPSKDARDEAITAVDHLTDRELTILEKVSKGLSNDALADQLCISAHTVRFHLHNIFQKLSAANRTQAVNIARRQGLIT